MPCQCTATTLEPKLLITDARQEAREEENQNASTDTSTNRSDAAGTKSAQAIKKQIRSWPVILSLEQGALRLSTGVILWLRKKPKRARIGTHPAWPGYTGVGTKLKVELEFKAYTSQCLVNNTVLSSYPMRGHRNLTPKQLAARDKIISMWNIVKDREEQLNTLELNKFTRLFDEFFFFGIMTKNSMLPRLKSKMWEMTPRNLAKHGEKYKKGEDTRIVWGVTCEEYLRGLGPFAKIKITGASFYEKDRTVVNAHFFLETLIHEMVHAYVEMYLCNCIMCFKDLPNNAGVTGHGRTFVLLLACIDSTLRSWGVGLSGLTLPVHDPRRPGTTPPHCLNEIRSLYEREQAHCKMIRDLAAEKGKDEAKKQANDKADDTSITPAPPSSPPPAPESTKDGAPPERSESMLMENLSHLVIKNFQFNDLREFTERVPGENVCITSIKDVSKGVTRVNPKKLEETGDLVQALIAQQTTLDNVKAWTKRNLDWEKLKDKASDFHLLRKREEESEAKSADADNAGEANKTAEANNPDKVKKRRKTRPRPRTLPKHEESFAIRTPRPPRPPPITPLPTLEEEEPI
ncbi:hypothetical protein F5B22DRAFT_369560 [Xylaria bambusicola]|uniref:uncharacterized protein n=1 Tax=Xylaria bambusicola TaxID=326684 RepID=UPI002008E519|nr:uncharacterized protein F5B22DRAFT_369560 [Xylaria bambusicola]KAI0509049.1 hypothetical protein F5B22DRAFT_369560 [Xylaria bambusicola]